MAEEANAVNEPVVADTTPTESAPVENKSEVTDDDADIEAFESSFGDDDITGTEETESEPVAAKSDKPAEETEPEPQPQGEDQQLSPKAQNRFQELANQNRELREQLERLQLQESQLATEQSLLNEINPETGDYYTPQEVERIAFQQSREQQQQAIAQQRYELEVRQNQQTLETEMDRAMKDFPMFNPNSPDYIPEIGQQVSQALLNAAIVDEKGTLLGSNISPYQYLQTIAAATQVNAAKNQAAAQKATEKMLANADVPSGSPQKGSGDELDELLDKIGDLKFV